MSSKKCLVLGGAGFIGSHVVDALLQEGYEVTVFDRPNVNIDNLTKSITSIRLLHGDISNPKDVEYAVEGMDTIFHFAATTLPASSNQNPVYDIETNLIATIELIKTALKYRIKKFIFSSSGGTVYGIPRFLPITEEHPTDPICSYGITKLAIEKYLALYGHLSQLPFIILRFGNPYGERQRLDGQQGAIPVFLGKLKKNEVIEVWGDGSVARDYFHISDLVSAVLKAAASNLNRGTFNIAGGKALTLLDIIAVMEKMTGLRPRVQFLPCRKLDVPVNYLNIDKARKLLGWEPLVGIEEGIKKTWNWINTKN